MIDWNSGQTDQSQQREPGVASGSQSGDQWENWQYWKQGRWETSYWEDEDRGDRDRPYLSHLDFPSFNGHKEEFAIYKYTVLNLKAQC